MASEKSDGKVVIKAVLTDSDLTKKLRKLASITKAGFKGTMTVLAGVSSAIGAGMVGLSKLATNFAETASDIKTGADKLGMTTDQFQEWKYVMERSGGSMRDLNEAMQGMKQFMDGVKDGTKDNIDALGRLQDITGVQIDLTADSATQFDQLTTALAKVEDPTERAAIAAKVFGDGASQKLLPALSDGADGLQKMKDKAHELGLVMDEETIEKGKKFQDTLKDLKDVLGATMRDAIEPMIPDLQNLADAFIKTMQGAEGADEELDKALSQTLSNMANFIADHLPDILEIGIKILLAIADGILQAVPQLVARLPEVIQALVDGIKELLPKLLEAGGAIVQGLLKGILDALGLGGVYDVGANVAKGFASGIEKGWSWVTNALSGGDKKAEEQVRKDWGVHSPSRVMMSIGEYLGKGFAMGIENESGEVVDAAQAQADGLKYVFVDLAEDGTQLGAAVSSAVLDGYNTTPVVEHTETTAEKVARLWAEAGATIRASFGEAFKSVLAGFEEVGTALAEGENGWSAFAKSALSALADILRAIGLQLAGMAVSTYPNFAQMALSAAGSAAAFVAAGVIDAMAGSFATGGIVPHKAGVPDSGDRQIARVNAGELILNRAQQGAIASQLGGASGAGSIVFNMDFGSGYTADEIMGGVYRSINNLQRRGVLPAWSVR